MTEKRFTTIIDDPVRNLMQGLPADATAVAKVEASNLAVTGGESAPFAAEESTLIEARLPPQPTEEQLREYLDRKRREAGGR